MTLMSATRRNPNEDQRAAGSLQPDCSAARLEDAIELAKRKAVDELNSLDWHEGNLQKWNIVERAIRDVLAVQQNDLR